METHVNDNNVKFEELSNYLSKCDIKPRRYHLITSINMIEDEDEEILVDDDDNIMLSEWQYVISVGEGVEDYKPGDIVFIDLMKFMTKIPNPKNKLELIETYNFRPIEIDDKVFTFMSENIVLGKKYDFEKVDLP